MAATAMLQLTFVALCWSSNAVAQWFPTAVQRELYELQRSSVSTIR